MTKTKLVQFLNEYEDQIGKYFKVKLLFSCSSIFLTLLLFTILWWLLVDGKPVDFVNSCRMRHADFDVVKVIGRGAFGEVQLVELNI